jgi:hypothetical protein
MLVDEGRLGLEFAQVALLTAVDEFEVESEKRYAHAHAQHEGDQGESRESCEHGVLLSLSITSVAPQGKMTSRSVAEVDKKSSGTLVIPGADASTPRVIA